MNPILNALVLYFVFRAIFKFRTLGDIDFFPYVYSGVLLLNFFTQSILQASEQLSINSPLLRRVRVPGEVFVLSSVCSNFINFFFGLVPLFIYFAFTGHFLTFKVFLIPLLLFSVALITLGISLFLSIAYVFFQDLKYFMPIITTLIFYISPVFYAIDMVGGKTRTIIGMNPLVIYLDSLRNFLSVTGSTNFRYIMFVTILGIIFTAGALKFSERNRMKAIFLS
jgi:ABC-type polysaccharide/polyol phosphate export permease